MTLQSNAEASLTEKCFFVGKSEATTPAKNFNFCQNRLRL